MPYKPSKTYRIYPWDMWQDGRTHVIHYGEDFTVSPPQMVIQLSNRARRTDTNVKINMQGDKIQFRYFEDSDERDTFTFTEPDLNIDRSAANPTCEDCGEPLHGYEVEKTKVHTGANSAFDLIRVRRENNGELPKVCQRLTDTTTNKGEHND